MKMQIFLDIRVFFSVQFYLVEVEGTEPAVMSLIFNIDGMMYIFTSQ